MKTRTRAAVAVLLAAAFVLAPAVPAMAAKPKPPAVDAYPELPSTIGRITVGHPNGPTLGKPGLRTPKWARAKIIAQTPSVPGGAPKIIGTPITAPSVWTKVVGGSNMFGAAFTGAWMLGAAGVNLYGVMTDTDPQQAMCGAPDWLRVANDLLSVTIAQRECSPMVNDPNFDSPATGSVGGRTAHVNQFTGSFTRSSIVCAVGPSLVGANQSLQIMVNGGTSGAPLQLNTQLATGGNDAGCGSLGGRQVHACTMENFVGGAANCPGRPYYITGISIVQLGTGAVVATGTLNRADPTRQVNCTIRWEDGTTTTGNGPTYTESTGFPVHGTQAACNGAYVSKPGAGPDLMPSEIKVGSKNNDTGAQTEISTQEVPDFTESERKGLKPGDGTGLKLLKVVDGKRVSCMTWAADCAQWWTATNQGTQTDVYRCTFGGADVDIAECGIYRFTFDVETDTPTIVEPGADAEPGLNLGWGTSTNGRNATDPGLGVSPGDLCFDEWDDAINPIDWVLHPVKCALVWAFAPRPAKLDDFGKRLDLNWKDSMPGQLALTFAGLGAAFDSLGAGNCNGITIDMPSGLNPDGSPRIVSRQFMNACGGILAPFAAATFWITTASILILGGISIRILIDKFVGNS